MKVSNLIAVVIRLFAIYWAVIGTVYSVSILGFVIPGGGLDLSVSYVLMQFAAPLWYMLLAFFAWLLSFKIGRLVVAGADSELKVIQLNQHEFCQVGVLLLGVFFVLTKIASMFNWIHYWIVTRRNELTFGMDSTSLTPDTQAPLYSFSDAMIPLLGGLFLIWKSRAISIKILSAGAQGKD